MSLASGSRVIWVDPYHSLVLEFEETTSWLMRKSLMSVLLWREVRYHVLILLLIVQMA